MLTSIEVLNGFTKDWKRRRDVLGSVSPLFNNFRFTLNVFFVNHDSTVLDLFTKIGPLQDPVTWYWINYAGTQVTQWDFKNKGKSGWTGTSSFVLEVPLCNLRPSVINSVPCDHPAKGLLSSFKCSLIVVPKVFRTRATILAWLRTKSLGATKSKRLFIFAQSEMLSRNNRPFLDTQQKDDP